MLSGPVWRGAGRTRCLYVSSRGCQVRARPYKWRRGDGTGDHLVALSLFRLRMAGSISSRMVGHWLVAIGEWAPLLQGCCWRGRSWPCRRGDRGPDMRGAAASRLRSSLLLTPSSLTARWRASRSARACALCRSEPPGGPRRGIIECRGLVSLERAEGGSGCRSSRSRSPSSETPSRHRSPSAGCTRVGQGLPC